jgi:hypothetical protein
MSSFYQQPQFATQPIGLAQTTSGFAGQVPNVAPKSNMG